MNRVERSTSVPIALLLAAPRTSRHASRTPHPRTPTCSLGPPVSQPGVATITGTRPVDADSAVTLGGSAVAVDTDGDVLTADVPASEVAGPQVVHFVRR